MKPGCTFDRGVSAILKQQPVMDAHDQNAIAAAMTVGDFAHTFAKPCSYVSS